MDDAYFIFVVYCIFLQYQIAYKTYKLGVLRDSLTILVNIIYV